MELLSIMLIGVLGSYLVHLNLMVGKYESKSDKSAFNYVSINDKKEENKIVEENITSEVVEEIVVDEPDVKNVVYDGKTMKELTETIEKSLSSTISGKGELITSYALEKGVDPYLATAIILHETGCKWGCSRLVRECNNVGGQKGKGCGSYAYFDTLDEGIRKFIDNLYKNYISYGLTTPEAINSKYAEDPGWAKNVSKYIEIIKAQ